MRTDRKPLIDDAFASRFLRAVSERLSSTELEHWQDTQASVRPEASRLSLRPTGRPRVRGGRESPLDSSEALTRPFQEQITSYIEARFGIVQDAPEEAFSNISRNFKSRGEVSFGRSFRYADEVWDDRRVFVNIERCLFHEFFRRNGALEVTPILCALDNVWADELSKARYGVRFERPTTLARGDDACRFQFTKTEPPE